MNVHCLGVQGYKIRDFSRQKRCYVIFKRHKEWHEDYLFFRKTLQIAKQLGDKALEAQACYSLGNTYTLLRDYDKAIEYHMRHLRIAQELNDRVGEGRACWSLGNAHTALGNHEKAIHFASKHLQISKEVSLIGSCLCKNIKRSKFDIDFC